jgi:hypothetical protein
MSAFVEDDEHSDEFLALAQRLEQSTGLGASA